MIQSTPSSYTRRVATFRSWERPLIYPIALIGLQRPWWEGSIAFQGADDQRIRLQPNEQLRVEGSRILVETVDPEGITAWRYNRMVFKNAPFTRVIERLQHDFAWTIRVNDESILQRKITAQIAENDPALLLEALSVLYDLNIRQLSDKEYLIE